MRGAPNLRVQGFRLPDPNGVTYSEDINGMYLIPYAGVKLTVIASDGAGWDHVSVSLRHRCPTHEELEFIRGLFFRDDECVVQYSVPRREHINTHPHCLHLWRPQGRDVPRPPGELVGILSRADVG